MVIDWIHGFYAVDTDNIFDILDKKSFSDLAVFSDIDEDKDPE